MQKSVQRNILVVMAHIIAWALFFILPYLIAVNNNQSVNWKWFLGYCAMPLACIFVFYINYFYLIKRVFFRKKLLGFLVINLLMILCLGLLLHFWQDFHRTHISPPQPEDILAMKRARPRPPAIFFIGKDLVLLALTAGLSVAFKVTGNWYKTENEKKELEKERAEAELQNLKSQLNPHFLFNTLNNIYSLIAINPEKAQLAVHDLSKLLRHVLYDNNLPLVALNRELEFMKSFIELMGLRLTKNTSLEVSLPQEENGIMIAPLLFISLIENAFKHGVSPTKPSFIRIVIETGEHLVHCRVENSNYPKKDNDRSGSGIGLKNLERRLQLLYPEKHMLVIEKINNTFIADLKITI